MIPYIVSLFLLGISFVLVEYAVGFKFKKSLARILYFVNEKLEPVAWFILLVVFLITTYYVCVVGWDFIYIILSITKAWGANPDLYFAFSVDVGRHLYQHFCGQQTGKGEANSAPPVHRITGFHVAVICIRHSCGACKAQYPVHIPLV